MNSFVGVVFAALVCVAAGIYLPAQPSSGWLSDQWGTPPTMHYQHSQLAIQLPYVQLLWQNLYDTAMPSPHNLQNLTIWDRRRTDYPWENITVNQADSSHVGCFNVTSWSAPWGLAVFSWPSNNWTLVSTNVGCNTELVNAELCHTRPEPELCDVYQIQMASNTNYYAFYEAGTNIPFKLKVIETNIPYFGTVSFSECITWFTQNPYLVTALAANQTYPAGCPTQRALADCPSLNIGTCANAAAGQCAVVNGTCVTTPIVWSPTNLTSANISLCNATGKFHTMAFNLDTCVHIPWLNRDTMFSQSGYAMFGVAFPSAGCSGTPTGVSWQGNYGKCVNNLQVDIHVKTPASAASFTAAGSLPIVLALLLLLFRMW